MRLRPSLATASTAAFFTALSLAACTHEVVRLVPPPASAPADDEAAGDVPAPTAPAEEPVTDPLVVDLGTVAIGKDVSFTVPPGALGFNVVVDGSLFDFKPDAPFGVERITDPSGNVVHDDFTPKGGTKPTSFAAFDAIAVASVPQGEGVSSPLADGTWTVRFGVMGTLADKPTLTAKVRVQATSDGAFHGGRLDLHVHVPSGLTIEHDGSRRSVSAADAENDPAIAERLDTFYALASQLLGIDRGSVVFHAAPSSLAAVDGAEELLAGFSVSKGSKDGEQALHVLLTNSISDQGQPIAAGISPGIPGAATRFGTNVSGIIVATAGRAEEDALTLLHEAGHFFGLNHTTEYDGDSADPLSDTPRCASIANQDLFSCPDRANVMFPAGAIDGPVALSPRQKGVYRGSPIYKAYPSATQRTMSSAAPLVMPARRLHAKGRALTPVEAELSLGFCGLTPLDPEGMVRRFGRDAAVAQLRAAAEDAGLSEVIRGRARLSLAALGEAR